jgi:competence protein ComEC
VCAAAGAWAAAALGGGVAPPVSIAVAVGGLVALCANVRRSASLAGLGIGLLLGGGSAAWHVHALRSGPVVALVGQRAPATLVVRLVRDPHTVGGASGSLVVADATAVAVRTAGWVDANSPVLLLGNPPGWAGLLPGQRVEITGRLKAPRPGDNVTAVVDVRGSPRALGKPPWWERIAGRARAALRDACGGLAGDERGLVPSLVDGDTSRVPASLQSDMRLSGLTHLEAVSGENLTVVLAVVLAIARGAGVRRRSRAIVAAAAVVAFVVLARPSPSVLRAAVMSGIVLLAMLTGRRTSPLPALCLAVVVLLTVDPFLARSVGFVLSVVATASLVAVAPRWAERLARHVPRPVAVAIAVPAAAQLACTPVLLLAFGRLTPYAVAANLVAGVAVAPATILGLVTAVVAAVSVAAAGPIAWLAGIPTAVVAGSARLFASLPGAAAALPHSLVVPAAALAALAFLVACDS